MNQKNLVVILGFAVVILLGTTIYFATVSNVSQPISAPIAQIPMQPITAQPAPTTPQITERNPQEIIYSLLEENEYKKEKLIKILESSSEHILARISAKPGGKPLSGYMLWASKVNGEWKEIASNNGSCDKKILLKNFFPQEWIVEYECL